MSVLPVGFASASGVDVGDIGHSLRLRSAAVAYLSRTPASAGNRRTWTWSGWIKLGALGANQVIFNQGGVSTNYTLARLNANNQLDFHSYGGASYNFQKVTSAVFRDPTAFIHVMFVLDATNTQARIYVNGAEAAYTTNTNPSNTDQPFNQAALHYIGAATSPAQYLDGYLSRIAFVDGTALTPSSFGYFNTTINEWVSKSQSAVKAVVDAGGTNSFMLDFDDATSLTTLGYDKSSKGNNWTLNNFSLTAGSTYDWMLDVPGDSYCTLNPLRGTGGTLSAGNLTFTNGVASHQAAVVTQAVTSGKWYAEGALTAIPTGAIVPGIGIRPITAGNVASGEFAGSIAGSFGGVCGPTNMVPYSGGVAGTAMAATITSTSVAHVALDVSAGKVWIGIDGAWIGGGDPAAGTLPTYTFTAGTGFEVYCSAYATVMNLLCGQAPLHTAAVYAGAALGYFRYTPPTGFKALCQANLPDPAILNPEKHFDAVTRVGFGASGGSVTSLQFKPDSYWGKVRNGVTAHNLVDSVRGVSNVLFSNLTNAEASAPTFLTSFNSNGYTMGAGDYTGAESVVEWLWKAGGAAVTNNAGSISSQVSANVDAGFSIVTYTGTGANATVGHGLGKIPKLVIAKRRNVGGYSWTVQHAAVAAGSVLFLETTNAATARATSFNSTYPTSSVFSLGTDIGTNNLNDTFVAYCFAEIPGYSKIGSYTGNGSADGPYVECGFKPKFVMIKRADSTGNWVVLDSIRSQENVVNDILYPNLSQAEDVNSSSRIADFLSNGFKPRNGPDADHNASGGTYIFLAFADVAGKYSLGR